MLVIRVIVFRSLLKHDLFLRCLSPLLGVYIFNIQYILVVLSFNRTKYSLFVVYIIDLLLFKFSPTAIFSLQVLSIFPIGAFDSQVVSFKNVQDVEKCKLLVD